VRCRIFTSISLVLFASNLFGQTAKEQLNAIVRDTQKAGNRAGRITLVWWMPAEFWQAALAAAGTIPATKAQEMVDTISDVNVVAVIDGKVGGFAQVDFVPQAELEKNLSASDGQGKPLLIIPESKQSTATRNLLAVMKPITSTMMGELGKNFSFFVFEGKNKDGSRRVDPAKPGSLMLRLGGEEFRWRLPLGSLLPEKICPKCNETLPGNYIFCPFDGTPLKDRGGPKP